jgi:cytochrome b561
MEKQPDLFNEPHSGAIRIWHTLFFIFTFASIVMVILGSTLFDTRDNISLVQEQVQRGGGSVSTDQARDVAHEYNDKLWMMHKYFGFGLSFLLLFRMGIALAGKREERVLIKLKKALQLRFASPGEQRMQRHYLFAKYAYLIFYVLIGIMALTGLVLAFEDVEFFRSIRKPVKNIHSIGQWGVYAYIFLHLGGVILADLTHSKGIVSRMVHGRKD